MILISKLYRPLGGLALLASLMFAVTGSAAPRPEVLPAMAAPPAEGYVAQKDGLKIFFNALSARLGKPVIVSKLAARKAISGEFDFSVPMVLLEDIAQKMGLIWYFDGQAFFIYDASELRSATVSLANITLSVLSNYLQQAHLYDQRYPLRGTPGSNVFYLSGPPAYVELVLSAADQMDRQPDGPQEREKTAVIQLENTFVGDRSYDMRDQKLMIPGIASVIAQLLDNDKRGVAPDEKKRAADSAPVPVMPPLGATSAAQENDQHWQPRASLEQALRYDPPAGDIRVIPNLSTNSLLVKGSSRQVHYVQNLVSILDRVKRHVELSLWIIDLQKDDLDQFGVEWQGNINVGQKIGMAFNTGAYSALDGSRFIASVMALSRKNRANIISRPIILTQENVPAIFDNNRTFYTKLLGERQVELQNVTFGTMISVLPRFTGNGQIEMALNIEDGSEISTPDREMIQDMLPTVGRTKISTIARVPKGKSLLIGGFTRDSNSGETARVPYLAAIPLIGSLFRYKKDSQSNMVRIFLIQPREITEPLTPDASDFIKRLGNRPDQGQMQDWTRNYLDSQKWQ